MFCFFGFMQVLQPPFLNLRSSIISRKSILIYVQWTCDEFIAFDTLKCNIGPIVNELQICENKCGVLSNLMMSLQLALVTFVANFCLQHVKDLLHS